MRSERKITGGDSFLGAGDPGALDALYKKFLDDPHSVPRDLARYFAQLGDTGTDGYRLLAEAYRLRGHLAANLDPLGLADAPPVPELDAAAYGLSPADARALRLQETYCGSIGWEFAHIHDSARRAWLQAQAETPWAPAPEQRLWLLAILARAQAFENFLQYRFPTMKRFGSEGAESFLCAIETILAESAAAGVEETVIGGMHRGRFALLALVAGKPLISLMSELAGRPPLPPAVDAPSDVPYHLGYSGERVLAGRGMRLSILPHPSHLQLVGAVTLGRARAKQHKLGRRAVLPLLIQSDAGFSGQGIVAETVQLSRLPAFTVGGTIHLIVNNRVGFTTVPEEGRSARYCSDVAKLVEAPVLHVNGDDVDAVCRVARIAAQYRARFGQDIYIDLVCYRRHGHNEIDEPRFTQPEMYQAIDARPPVPRLYAGQLSADGLDTSSAEAAADTLRTELDAAFKAADGYEPNRVDAFEGAWQGFGLAGEADMLAPVETGLPLDRLRTLGRALTQAPKGFALEPKVTRFLDRRRASIVDGAGIAWATAEALALASLVAEGTPVRLTGQDTPRGAFTQRHLILHDQVTGARHCVLGKGAEACNTPLTEYAVLAFEYGLTLTDPGMLTVWEAQFGDFLNVAQPVFDQLIACGEDRWQRSSGLVLLLPHGHDGGGPDHSTAHPERLLAACARGNIEVVNVSTPANYFHLLRRQIRRSFRKPLVVLSPKALLRHRAAVSALADMGPGKGFLPVLPDGMGARRVVLCSGKIYYELSAARAERGQEGEIALVRLEQLYPFPQQRLRAALRAHPKAEVVWCQEEPENMGAYGWLDRRLEAVIGERVRYVGRPPAASPAAGFTFRHDSERQAVLESALTPVRRTRRIQR